MTENELASNFIHTIIEADLEAQRHQTIVTRFPPEPNGYLHIGHTKAIFINFGSAEKYGGRCHLRFDDTNPVKEDTEYVDAIKDDIRWLGYEWGEHEYYASDYFDKLYDLAVDLIKKGHAYVDSLSAEQMREYRGTLKEPGKNSPYRERSIDESLELFAGMKRGDFDEGTHILRAKIDMASPNINLRDPALYRIRKAHHHRTGDTWKIYPMYDYAHGLSDAIEGISHSLCSLEFEAHRPLYDWFLEVLDWPAPRPHQYEFARLNLTRTLMSKRYLLKLVQEGQVTGWDDPRMPTIRGLRRKGVTAAAIRNLSERIGVAKSNSEVDIALFEFCIREDLNKVGLRRMAVLDPIKVVITNYPEDKVEMLTADNNPEDPDAGTRDLAFGRELYIEQDDFMEDAPRKFFRMAPGKEVRLKHAYYITCNEVIKNDAGEVVELHCTYDPASRGGWTDDGRKVKGTLHWVSAQHAQKAEIRVYDHLLKDPSDYDKEAPMEERINPDSITVSEALIEPALAEAKPGERVQFLRKGYYCMDPDSTPERPVFNQTVGLVDTWAKLQKNKK